MKVLFVPLSLVIVPSSGAAVIAATNFDDTVKSSTSQTMTGLDWTGDDLLAVTPGTSVTTTASNHVGYFTTGFGATGFAPDQNIENEGPWTANFTLILNDGTTGTLTTVSFHYAALTNFGTSQGTNFRAQNLDITVNGTGFDVQRQTTAVKGSLTFTGSGVLNAGLNTIQIISSEVNGPGSNMGIDNLSFEGDLVAVPEPSVSLLALLALPGLMIRRR